MNVNLDLYRIFYAVATNGSISSSSSSLFISQPAITFQIKNLEEQLGVTLFIRTKKGMTLTEEGKILYEYVKIAIESINNGENTLANLKNLDSGIIRIGASTTVSSHVLIPYLEIFHEKYPNIEIQILNNLTTNLVKELKNGNLDLLLLNMPMEETKDLKIFPIIDVQDVFVGNKKYYDMTKGNIDLNKLNSFPLIFQKSPSNTRAYLDKYLKSNNVILKPSLEVVSYNLIMDLVKAGFGIGYATKEFIKNELDNNTLYKINVTPKVPKRFIGIAVMNKKIPNYSVKKLIDLMVQKI